MTAALLVIAVVLSLVGIAGAPFTGGLTLLLAGAAVVVLLYLLAAGSTTRAGSLPRAPDDQFLGPGGPDDPERGGDGR